MRAIARWFLKAQGPRAVSGFGGRFAFKNDGGETPDVQEIIYSFDNCVVTWSGREVNRTRDEYLAFHGTLGTLNILRTGYTITPEGWGKKAPKIVAKEVKTNPQEMIPIHMNNFLDCIVSRQHPNADVEDGHLTAAFCRLGNIATRLGRTLTWDAAASAMLGRKERAPWKL
jgi:predicted dehydrogenase